MKFCRIHSSMQLKKMAAVISGQAPSKAKMHLISHIHHLPRRLPLQARPLEGVGDEFV